MRAVALDGPSSEGTLGPYPYSLWLPPGETPAGVVVLHDSGASKEHHYDFARAATAAGLACVCLDLTGADIAAVVQAADLLRPRAVGLWGSGTGGGLALLAARAASAEAIVAISPNAAAPLHQTVAAINAPILLLHAEADERVPVQQSRELARHFTNAGSRLIVVPGGHHGSVERDAEIRAVSLRLLNRELRGS